MRWALAAVLIIGAAAAWLLWAGPEERLDPTLAAEAPPAGEALPVVHRSVPAAAEEMAQVLDTGVAPAPGGAPESPARAVGDLAAAPPDAAGSGNGEIVGVVVDGEGAPVAGVRVDWVEEGKQPRRAPDETGTDGRFRATFLRRGPKGAIVATHPYRLGEARVEWPPAAGATEARLVLAGGPAGALHVWGPLPDPKDPPRGALILTPLLEGGPATHHPFDGTHRLLESLEPGRWHVRFVPIFSPWLPLEDYVQVEAGSAVELDIAPERGETLEGIVLQADRAPAAGFKVTARMTWAGPPRTPRAGGSDPASAAAGGRYGGRFGGSRTLGTSSSTSYTVGAEGASVTVTTDAHGRFRLTGIPREGAVLEVDQEGRPFAVGTVRPGAPLEVVLPGDPPSLLVRLSPLPGRRPEWRVEVWGGDLKSPRSANGKTEARFRALAAGDYVVLATGRHPDGPLAGLARTQVVAGGGVSLDLRPERTATVTYSVVVEETGLALRSAEESVRVGAVEIRQDWWWSRADGKVEFPPNEDFVLRLKAEGREPAEIPLRLAPGETRDLGEIRLRRAR